MNEISSAEEADQQNSPRRATQRLCLLSSEEGFLTDLPYIIVAAGGERKGSIEYWWFKEEEATSLKRRKLQAFKKPPRREAEWLAVYCWALAFEREARACILWHHLRGLGHYDSLARADVMRLGRALTGKSPDAVADWLRLGDGLFWRLQGDRVLLRGLKRLRRLAYRRQGFISASAMMLPMAIVRGGLGELRAYFSCPAMKGARAGREGCPAATSRRYTALVMRRSVKTVSARRVRLRAGDYIRTERNYERLERARSLRRPSGAGRNYFLGSDGHWHRRLADLVLLDSCRFFVPYNKTPPLHSSSATPPQPSRYRSPAPNGCLPPLRHLNALTGGGVSLRERTAGLANKLSYLYDLHRSIYDWLVITEGGQPPESWWNWPPRIRDTLERGIFKSSKARYLKVMYFDGERRTGYALAAAMRDFLWNECQRFSRLEDKNYDRQRQLAGIREHSQGCYTLAMERVNQVLSEP